MAAQAVRSPAPQCGSPTKVGRGQVTWLMRDADEERMKKAVRASV